VRPDLPQPTHGLEEEDTLRSILLVRLKVRNVRSKEKVCKGGKKRVATYQHTVLSKVLYQMILKIKFFSEYKFF
jgi:hypothetical protein